MGVQLAFALLDEIDDSITEEALLAQIRADWPDLDPNLLSAGADESDGEAGAESEDGPLVISYGEVMISLMTIGAPIGDDLGEIAAHSRLWPDAEAAPADYRAHMIAAAFQPGDDADHTVAIARAGLLSQVLASLIAVSQKVRAIYWGAAEHVIFPPLFRDFAQKSLPEPMTPAWVALNVGARPDGVMTGHTLGLDELGVMDIEIPETSDAARDALDRLIGLADYQLSNGPVIGDGDTIGASADDIAVVAHHTPSAFDDEKTVLMLTSAQPEPKKKRVSRYECG